VTNPATGAQSVDVSIVIKCAPGRVLKAFFDHNALGAWWQVRNSVTTPRALGAYAIEWDPTDFRDDVLGRLGGTLRGTVMQYDATRGFFVADVFHLPPDAEPIGPMALEVTLTPVTAPDGTPLPETEQSVQVRIVQSGFEEGARWRRYYELVHGGWERALHSLKMLLEK
jgi:Activator of Hsp90 ATPase homolog 1-like protein